MTDYQAYEVWKQFFLRIDITSECWGSHTFRAIGFYLKIINTIHIIINIIY